MRSLETERLILRPWREEDTEALYEYARDPQVGPACGWKPHESVEDSLAVLRTVLMNDQTWAVTVRERGDEPVGSVGIFPCEYGEAKGEPEIGYWIGVPFWGQGLIPEAVRELQRYVFTETDAARCWCSHNVTNDKSRRVIEKCGFACRFTAERYDPQLDSHTTGLFYCITREEWLCRNI